MFAQISYQIPLNLLADFLYESNCPTVSGIGGAIRAALSPERRCAESIGSLAPSVTFNCDVKLHKSYPSTDADPGEPGGWSLESCEFYGIDNDLEDWWNKARTRLHLEVQMRDWAGTPSRDRLLFQARMEELGLYLAENEPDAIEQELITERKVA